MDVRLDHVPPLGAVADVASEVRRSWGLRPTSRLNLDRVCARLRIEVSVVSMGVPSGGAQGFLIPTLEGGFRIEVDPEPARGWDSVAAPLRKPVARHRTRFLIAHELSHILFFEPSPRGPRRLVPDGPRQERFCDELARALLVPPQAAAETGFTPEAVVSLQRHFDVSMEVALRSVAQTAEDHGKGVAWLLLHRRGEVLVQWTSADRQLTAGALRHLRRLSGVAAERGRAEGRVAEGDRPAHALYLPGREQVIVTQAA